MNLRHSPYVNGGPLDIPGDIKHLETAIAAKEKEIARLKRELRTKH